MSAPLEHPYGEKAAAPGTIQYRRNRHTTLVPYSRIAGDGRRTPQVAHYVEVFGQSFLAMLEGIRERLGRPNMDTDPGRRTAKEDITALRHLAAAALQSFQRFPATQQKSIEDIDGFVPDLEITIPETGVTQATISRALLLVTNLIAVTRAVQVVAQDNPAFAGMIFHKKRAIDSPEKLNALNAFRAAIRLGISLRDMINMDGSAFLSGIAVARVISSPAGRAAIPAVLEVPKEYGSTDFVNIPYFRAGKQVPEGEAQCPPFPLLIFPRGQPWLIGMNRTVQRERFDARNALHYTTCTYEKGTVDPVLVELVGSAVGRDLGDAIAAAQQRLEPGMNSAELFKGGYGKFEAQQQSANYWNNNDWVKTALESKPEFDGKPPVHRLAPFLFESMTMNKGYSKNEALDGQYANLLHTWNPAYPNAQAEAEEAAADALESAVSPPQSPPTSARSMVVIPPSAASGPGAGQPSAAQQLIQAASSSSSSGGGAPDPMEEDRKKHVRSANVEPAMASQSAAVSQSPVL